MSDSAAIYREDLFQWIWQNLEFNCQNVKTVCGKKLLIIDPGKLNHGAGPDFLEAHIQTEKIRWHGSVEIHKTSADWHAHHHESDKNFENVILHVVFADNSKKVVKTSGGDQPMVLELKPYLNKNLNRLLELKESEGLACSGNVAYINQKAFEKQIEIAHKEYFDYKVNELLQEYNASQRLSEAWRDCLVIQLYKTLGIPANREQMGKLARKIIASGQTFHSPVAFLKFAEHSAFSENQTPDDSIDWAFSGMRPASRPGVRIKQAAELHFRIIQANMKDFLKDPLDSWALLQTGLPSSKKPGCARLELIKQTVYLPAIYLLGDLLHSGGLKERAYRYWLNGSQNIPEEVRKPFVKAGFELSGAVKKLGLAHQYKRYCIKRNCHRCEVFKKSISS